jgi:hypothetical protein
MNYNLYQSYNPDNLVLTATTITDGSATYDIRSVEKVSLEEKVVWVRPDNSALSDLCGCLFSICFGICVGIGISDIFWGGVIRFFTGVDRQDFGYYLFHFYTHSLLATSWEKTGFNYHNARREGSRKILCWFRGKKSS